ncbi:LacI family DNA-binding transcriptional regulator [Bifidobacterium sp. ESL0745]|uniref:LacI family DNA-binding transcriptional regulator n=1 Tax=Bifidobacterium sp. ESL0745 TaxID=2983226 RepID=UPI0023F96FE2|nr:LacI family DNA-binding transcriptional regulator [Bifidobacterium sp. ESL0745]MDF7664701.1 LacI family DNA-binding transcriptional regulator [Bifidobacterium sp. ESL0745]
MGDTKTILPNKSGRMPSKRVGLKDVADELGISQTAVSFAVNDKPGVSDETKRKVKETAARMGWSPVYAAQALSSSRTMTVGFVPSRSGGNLQTETFMLHFMAGLHDSLSRKGYGILYRPAKSLQEELSIYRDWSKRKRVDGVVLVDLRSEDPRPKLLNELNIPAVLAGGPDPEDLVPSLSIDDSGTMEKILKHLLAVKRTRITYFSGNRDLDYSKMRVAAFNELSTKYALEFSAVSYTNFDAETAAAQTCSMMNGSFAPNAFIYENETMAAASLRALEQLAFSKTVPAGLQSLDGDQFPHNLPAIVSFEDSFICTATYPSITAVHRDPGEYGKRVANLLIKCLSGEPVSGNRRILQPTLVVRESTGGSGLEADEGR